MPTILAITLPIFLLIGLGFAVGKLGGFSADQARGLGRFVLSVALPALVFHSLATRRVEELFQPGFLAVYGFASLTAFAIGFAWFRRDAALPRPVAAIRAMGVSFSNSGFVGLPILLQLFGPAGAVPVALAMLVENLLMFPLALTLAGGGEARRGPGAILLDLARTPLIVAILAGLAVSLLGLPLPELIERPVTMLAAASAPVALFATGAGLVGAKLRGSAASIAPLTLGKLVMHPLLVLGLSRLIPIGDPGLASAALLLAAMPMLSVFPVLAQRHGDGELCGAALLVTTAASFFTVSALLWALA